ncbi:hypothetical protein O6H91_01G022700 [Diphasiastrum complanatum]|uniref:Uncharacterized protein n=1 Tax=Diphasiastrum complanatum TaxID=34168 RepID=A0ACC2EP51_DIPCM|nr:hypothetical protein O6H91_01G022700 [Diphasiastrum complanatum]
MEGAGVGASSRGHRAGGVVVVEDGDTLWTLSRKLGVEWQELQAANSLKDELIFAGEVLKLPPHPHLKNPRGAPPSWQRRTKPLVVQPGDTAWDISERYGISVEELQEVNSIVLDVLFPGDVLLVPEEAVERPRQIWAFKSVKPRIRGIAGFANANFFDVFPPLQDIDKYREKHRLLLNAIRHVETSFIFPAPTGDGGSSIGPLQISETTKYEQCEEVEYAERTVINYWLHYCPWALEFNDLETLARTHNGGPQFWHHLSTRRYWRKVRKALRRQGYRLGIPNWQMLQNATRMVPSVTARISLPSLSLEL